jgi:hypothetical protein
MRLLLVVILSATEVVLLGKLGFSLPTIYDATQKRISRFLEVSLFLKVFAARYARFRQGATFL